jgi:hypothetical protein
VRQIVKKDLGTRNFSAKIVPRILTHDQIQRRLHISSDLLRNAEVFHRVITGDETWCFQYDSEKTTEHAVENTEFTSAGKSTFLSVTDEDHACVFLRSQGNSSLRIYCTRTNDNSTVLFGNANKVTGIRSEEKTRNLA